MIEELKLNQKQAAEEVGVTVRTIREWIKLKKFSPSLSEGGRLYYSREDLFKLKRLKALRGADRQPWLLDRLADVWEERL